MKLVYLGTPQMAVPPLDALVDAGHEIVLVVTGVDKRRGRGKALSPTPVKERATALGIPVSHDVDDVLNTDADAGVVVAFGQIIRPHVLAKIEMVNVHFSLLPRWRGAAPVERAILAGDAQTGVCIMEVAEGLDTGDVYAEVTVDIDHTVTAAELRARLVAVGSALLVETLVDGFGDKHPQHGEPTYAKKITPDDLRIDWSASAETIARQVRVGGAWTTFRGDRFKIHDADIVGGELVPTVVQPAGKPRMDADAWRNGARPAADEHFS